MGCLLIILNILSEIDENNYYGGEQDVTGAVKVRLYLRMNKNVKLIKILAIEVLFGTKCLEKSNMKKSNPHRKT